MIFKLEITGHKPGSYSAGFQEVGVIQQLLAHVARDIGNGLSGKVVYDGVEIGNWEFGEDSLKHREHVNQDGPGTAKAREREEQSL